MHIASYSYIGTSWHFQSGEMMRNVAKCSFLESIISDIFSMCNLEDLGSSPNIFSSFFHFVSSWPFAGSMGSSEGAAKTSSTAQSALPRSVAKAFNVAKRGDHCLVQGKSLHSTWRRIPRGAYGQACGAS